MPWRCLQRETDAPHETGVTGIRTDAVEVHRRQLGNSDVASLIRLLQPVERRIGVAQPGVDYGKMDGRHVPFFGHGGELIQDAGRLRAVPGAPIDMAQKRPEQRSIIQAGAFRQSGDGLRKVALARVRDA